MTWHVSPRCRKLTALPLTSLQHVRSTLNTRREWMQLNSNFRRYSLPLWKSGGLRKQGSNLKIKSPCSTPDLGFKWPNGLKLRVQSGRNAQRQVKRRSMRRRSRNSDISLKLHWYLNTLRCPNGSACSNHGSTTYQMTHVYTDGSTHAVLSLGV